MMAVDVLTPSTSNTTEEESIKALLTVKYSVKGLHSILQKNTYVHFADFLDECTDEDIGYTLEDVLVFFSGASCVPPLDFDSNPTLVFLHSKTAKLPTASTCDLQLHIPASYEEYHKFKEAIILGFKGHDGFGGV